MSFQILGFIFLHSPRETSAKLDTQKSSHNFIKVAIGFLSYDFSPLNTLCEQFSFRYNALHTGKRASLVVLEHNDTSAHVTLGQGTYIRI